MKKRMVILDREMFWKRAWLSVVVTMGLCAGAGAELISYHRFDEGAGTTAADATGKGNNGTFNGNVQWVPGKKGSAVRLDTAGERIVIGKINPSGANQAMTLAAWINWEGSGHATITHQGIFGKRGGWTAPGDNVKWFWEAQPDDDLAFRTYSTSVTVTDALVNHKKEWTHVALTWEKGTVIHYLNGVQIHKGSITFNETSNDVLVTIGCVASNNSETFVGTIDEARIYDTALTPTGIVQAMTGDTWSASTPGPGVGATDVPRDTTLTWAPGDYAAAHNVYFGASFDDVNTADLTKAVSQGQTGTTFQPATLLEYGKTYYWRIDEVNKTPDNTIFKGQVWSFTVEPYGYRVTPVKATASSAQDKMGPEKTIDGSGLTGDLHGTVETTMWLTAGAAPNWIQYEFDKVYKLHEMVVWNSNQLIESLLGFGAKSVTVETSTDGTTWTAVQNVPEFSRAPGTAGYAANTTVSLGVEAKFVRLTIASNWGGLTPTVGLSEVRFSSAPVQARSPQPALNATGVNLDAKLDWRPGREATSHKVFFGTDGAAVLAGTAPSQTATGHSFDPGVLNFGTSYYWRVDEIGPTTYPGNIWTFTTRLFQPIEDFESYTDKAGAEIFTAWVDGFADNFKSSGSTVGLSTAVSGTFGETTIRRGAQSMPLQYDNTKTPFYSEAVRTFDQTQDWTANGANTLSLWFRGWPVDFIDKGNGAFTVAASGHDIWDAADDFRFVYKKLSGDGSIVVKVDSLLNTNASAKAGVMIRQGLEDGSAMVDMILTATAGVGMEWRPTMGAGAVATNAPKVTAIRAPQWVKLIRKGNTFTAQYSADGQTWLDIKNPMLTGTPVSVTVNLMGDVYIGLCVTSHDRNLTTVAELSGAATTGNVTGTWQPIWIGDDLDRANDPAGLYVTVVDSAGKSATVAHPDPAAANLNAWTEWKIALSDLKDVNLTKIKKLTIGVGDRASPKAGGGGMLYVDDVQFGGLSAPGAPLGLVAAYSFEDNVKDSTAHGYDGTILGAPTFVAGLPANGKALKLNGTTDCVELGKWWPAFNFPASFSLSVWANIEAWTTNWGHVMVSNRGESGIGWQLRRRNSNKICFTTRGVGQDDLGSTMDAPLNEWVHIAAVYDNTGNTKRIYVNGVEDALVTTNFGKVMPTTHNAYVGARANSGNTGPETFFTGMLDEIKIYDLALTPAEVLKLAGK